MKKTTDIYKEVKEFKFSNMTVRVHIPDITEEERERRMKAVTKAAIDLLLSVEKSKKASEILG